MRIGLVKYILLFSLVSSFACSSYAQQNAKKERKLFKKARKHLSNEKYTSAQKTYLELLALNATSDVYQFETGLSYYFSDFERTKSVQYFENALKQTKEDTIPELYYYLGKAYQLNYQFDEAAEALTNFKRFIKKTTKPGQYLLRETEESIGENKVASELEPLKDQSIQIVNLGAQVNTLDREYAPVFRETEKVLLFTSRRKDKKGRIAKDLLPYEDIYVAKKNEDASFTMLTDAESLSKHLPKDFNTKKHDAGIIYSADGMTLYTYKKDKLWLSEFKDGNWSELQELSDDINDSKFNVPSISISKDGNTIFFVATRKDGYGGKDIYRSRKTKEGSWAKPEIMGPEINTPEDEDAPYLSLDGKTFYFSSTGHNTIGGYDIFKSTITGDSIEKPANMGFPLNSPEDDIYFIIDEENREGFFASAREGGYGGMDIYEFSMKPEPKIKRIDGLITDEDNKYLHDALVKLTDSSDSTTSANAENGKFELSIASNGTHTLSVESPDYQNQAMEIEIPKDGDSARLGLVLTKFEDEENNYQVLWAVSEEMGIDKKDTIVTKKLIAGQTDSVAGQKSYRFDFGYNKTDITADAAKYNSMIADMVKKASNQEVLITIESSASKVPTKTFGSNNKLAEARADAAKELIIKGIEGKADTKKIVFKDIKTTVAGPAYQGDFNNLEKYEPFQYVRVIIQ